MPTLDQIVSLYSARKLDRGPVINRMQKVADVYNGDMVVPLEGRDRTEEVWIPNLLQPGMDQAALRISSTTPDVRFLPEKEGVQLHLNRANDRLDAVLAWWTMNKMGLKLRRRARHLIGYGCTPVIVRPHKQWEMPVWHARNPLSTFPGFSNDPDDITPHDCIFAFQRSLKWLQDNFDEPMRLLYKGENPHGSHQFELLEYVDCDTHVLACLGKPKGQWDVNDGRLAAVELLRFPNRAEVCPVVVPGRITLDRTQGAYDGIVGVYQMQAK